MKKSGKPPGKAAGGKGKKPPTPPKRTVSIMSGSGGGFVSEYTHYRTGKLMVASAYGHKAWPFGYRRG